MPDAVLGLVSAFAAGGFFSAFRFLSQKYGANPEKWDLRKVAPTFVGAFIVWALAYYFTVGVMQTFMQEYLEALVILVNVGVMLVLKWRKYVPPPQDGATAASSGGS